MMSEGLRLLQIEKGLKEGTSYTARVFAPSILGSLEGKVTIGAKSKVDLLGRVVALTEVTTEIQSPMGAGTITSVSYVDSEFTPQKMIMPIAGMNIEMVACDKAFASSPNDAVDFFSKTFLQSPAPASELAKADSATYYLQPKGGKKITGIVSTGSQSVRPGPDGQVIVEVRLVKAPAGVKFPYTGSDKAALAALKPNRFIESDRKEVIDLARKAIDQTKDAASAVKAIETYVNKHISKKSLSVGYATAAEVAQSMEGDCTEHAVLTAAMCRAVGIPARVVVGYLNVESFGYYSNIFGGHAWTEAYVGDIWIGLDAARGGFTTGHLAQTVGNGEPADFFDMITTTGNFEIAKVTIGDRSWSARSATRPAASSSPARLESDSGTEKAPR